MQLKGKNHLFRRFILLIIFPYFFFGAVGVLQFVRLEQTMQVAQLWEEIKSQELNINTFFSERKAELLLLQHLIAGRDFSEVGRILNSFMSAGSLYGVSYYMDLKGRLRFSTMKSGNHGFHTQAFAVQFIQNRLKYILSRQPGQVFVSQVNLYIPNKNHSSYYEPLIYFALPIFGTHDRPVGILVGEVKATQMIQTFKNQNDKSHGQSILLRRDGVYIAHNAASKEWGSELGTKENVVHDFSPDMVWRLLSGKPGVLKQADGALGVFVSYLPDPGRPELFWVILHLARPQTLAHILKEHQKEMLLGVMLFLFSLGMVWYFYSQYLIAEKKLEQARMNFIAILTHDLKSPLATIKASVDALIRGKWTPENISKVGQLASDAIQRMMHVIMGFLDLSKYEAGKMPFHGEKISLYNLVKQTLALFEDRANEKKIQIHASLKEGIPDVWIDKEKLERALMNLIDNALKFTPEGGNIHLAVQKKFSGIEIRVSDSGRGIPPPKLSRLFEKYEQGTGAGFSKGGTGLGLPIVKEIIQAHHGKIRVTSRVGEGTTFVVTLPLHGVGGRS